MSKINHSVRHRVLLGVILNHLVARLNIMISRDIVKTIMLGLLAITLPSLVLPIFCLLVGQLILTLNT